MKVIPKTVVHTKFNIYFFWLLLPGDGGGGGFVAFVDVIIVH
jgi:hypothetical protein